MSTSTEQDARDRADMADLVGGRDAALNDLMDRHGGSIYRFLVRMLGQEWDAEDLAQETFVRVYRARATYRPDKTFVTWLYTIAANLARNHLRWRARHPAVSLDASQGPDDSGGAERVPDTQATPEQELETGERAACVRAAVQRLPDDLREALVLCEWESLTMAEAARILQTTPKAVESRLYRARKQMRKDLTRWLDG